MKEKLNSTSSAGESQNISEIVHMVAALQTFELGGSVDVWQIAKSMYEHQLRLSREEVNGKAETSHK